MVELPVVDGYDLILGLAHGGVDETLDAVCNEGVCVDRLLVRLGNLQHDRPVGPLSLGLAINTLAQRRVSSLHSAQLDVLGRAVVGRVVGEDGCTVEGRVGLGEVEPACR